MGWIDAIYGFLRECGSYPVSIYAVKFNITTSFFALGHVHM